MKDHSIRYTHPGKYDVAPYGTICKVMGDNDTYEIFVQCSEDSSSSDWKPIGSILEEAFKPFVNEFFLTHCLYLSSGKLEDRAKHLQAIARIIVQ